MKFFSSVAALALACSSVTAHPVQNDEGITLEERASTVVVTTGAGGSTVYPRLEIRQMKDNYPNQYALLVLAMQQWQAQGQSSATSYFGVASIHGVPRQSYNGVAQCSACGGSDGYCPHDSVLFPAWHRAYMAHFEQEFLAIVQTVANSYPSSQKATMVAAANQMRWPYWDFAAKPPSGRPVLPKIVTDTSVTVNGPSGSTTFTNPLFRYDIADPSGFYYSTFTTWKRTYRYPTTNDNTATSQTTSAINAFANIRQSLADQLYSLFTSCSDYLHFSNDDAGSSSSSCSNSLEGIHNTVHTTCGGTGTSSVSGGHMTYLPLASYDPIFWLLHCNVDRIFAMWQRLHPNSYGASQVAPHNTWTIAQGLTKDANSALTPFYRNSNGGFWTTNLVKDWTVFKYTYPEFADSDGTAASITKYVNNLYGPNANAVAGSSKRGIVADTIKSYAGALDSNPFKASNGSLFQYVANIQTPRYVLNGSYTVFLFKGDPSSEQPLTWATDKNLIGTMGVLSQEGMSDKTILASGSIPLTRTLQDIVGTGLLADLTEALVVPYLTSTLKWRIQGPQANCVDPGTLEGFVLSVFASTATDDGNESTLPVYSDFVSLLDVTKGQSGGANTTAAAYGTSAPTYSS